MHAYPKSNPCNCKCPKEFTNCLKKSNTNRNLDIVPEDLDKKKSGSYPNEVFAPDKKKKF